MDNFAPNPAQITLSKNTQVMSMILQKKLISLGSIVFKRIS